jgi:hypothetical protein
MTDIQAAAIAKADASMKPALDLYAERCKLWRRSCDLALRDLERLNRIIEALSPADLKRVAAYAEGLAEWGSPEASSPDVPVVE